MRTLALILPLLAVACSPKFIGDTRIEDTVDNRDILDLVSHYKSAYEAKDAKGIAALASPRYLDARDSISYATLEKDLDGDFKHAKQVQLDVSVRRIDVKDDVAEVDYYYSTSFLLDSMGAAWQTNSDDKRMRLAREDGKWRVLSGF